MDAAHACYVGNHPEVDVAGAKAAGLRAIWCRDPFFETPVDADAVIDAVTMQELSRLLSRA